MINCRQREVNSLRTLEGLVGNQRKAVEQLDKTMAVSAGAGSGKTRVLVRRFSSLLVGNLAELEEIAAITFTNKAAAEMKQRIREQLQEITKTVGEGAERERLETVVRRIEGAQISTIHSFCANVLQSYPLEAGIDAEISLLEETENRLILEESLDHLWDEGLEQKEDWAVNLFLEYGEHNSFFGEIIDVYQKIRGAGGDWLQVVGAGGRFDGEIREKIAAMDSLLQELLAQEEDFPLKSREKIQRFFRAWEQQKPTFLTILEGGESCLPSLEDLKASLDRRVAKDVKVYFGQIDLILEEIELAFADRRGQLVKGWLFELFLKLDQEYTARKEQIGVLDFTDLELLTLKLFQNYPRVAEECCQRYKYVLVDEVQDINPIQEKIIYYLTCDQKDGCLLPAKLFAVGDEKQSIYRFRGADVRVFSRLKEKVVAEDGVHLPLEKNFRSRKQLVEFFNRLFLPLMGSLREGKEGKDYEAPYSSAEFVRNDDGTPPVELLLVKTEDGEELSAVQIREMEAALIARRIQKMVRGQEEIIAEETGFRAVNYGDIALLVRATTDLLIYEREFKKRNIPYLVSVGKGFYNRQEIIDVLNLARFLLDEGDNLSFVALLRSPFFGLADTTLFWLKQEGEFKAILEGNIEIPNLKEEEGEKLRFVQKCLEQLRQRMNLMPVSQLLREAVALTGYEEVVLAGPNGRQVAANLHKLFSLIEGWEQRGLGSLRELVHYFQLLTDREEREGEAEIVEEGKNAVRIMTVHGSKGLEFPVVFVPDLSRKPREDNGLFLYDDNFGLGIKVVDSQGQLKPTSVYNGLKQLSREMDRAENKRLFYVALTRAEDYLVLGMNDGKPLKLKEPLSREEILTQSNDWLSWLKGILGYVEGERGEIEESGIVDWNGGISTLVYLGEEEEGNFSAEEEQGEISNLDLSLLPTISPEEREEEFTFSPTALLTYLQCPRKFYFSHRLYLPSDKPEDGMKIDPSFSLPARLRGNLVHHFCELYQEGMDLDSVFDQCLRREGIEEGNFAFVRGECFPLIKRYLQSQVYQEICRAKAVYSEWPFIYRQGRLVLQGKIDKLLFTEQGLKIIDFKTDLISPEGVEERAGKYKLQLELYSLAAARIFKEPISAALVHFIVPDLSWTLPSSVGEEEIARNLAELGSKASAKDPKQFVKTEEGCELCNYSFVCSYY
jgi:ATP-dependent helicase/nuclease subunit A